MKLSDILLLLKGGKRGVVGEIRTWANGKRMKKTVDKWVEVNEHGQPKEKKAKAESKKKKETPVKKEKKPAAKKKFSDSEIKVKAEKVKKKLKEAKPKKEKAVKKETKKEAPKQEPIQKENKDEPKTENQQDYKTNGVKAKAFKSWFGDWEQAKQTGDYSNVSKVLNEKKEPQEMSSVMVDDTGEPLMMFHGTTADFFTEFDKNKARGGNYGAGFYFTENKEKANNYRYRDENANSAFDTLDELAKESRRLNYVLSGKQLNGVRDPFQKINNYILEIKGKYGKSDLEDIFQAEGELKDEIIKIHSMLNDRIKEMNSHKVLKKEHGEIKINPDVDKFVIDMTNPKSQDKREEGLKKIYLDIKKPFYIDFTSDKLSHEINIANLEKLGDKQLLEAYKSTSWGGGIKSYAYAGRYKDEPKRGETKEQREKRKKDNDDAFLIFSNLLKSKGFDGTIMASFKENGDIDRKKIFENNEVHKFKKYFSYDEVVAFEPNQIKSVDNSGDFNPKENNMYKSFLILLKGKRAAVGEIRNWKGGAYIKTATGWKPHEKQYSKKYTERKNNAATKKDTDLRKRQSEVARLSGEIQGHKAAVEHHTAQNTKQDTRQAKHHSIRAQVKQRRLDKHKEILEQRHGVKDEVNGIEKVDPIKNPEKFKADFIAELKKQTNNSQPESWYKYQASVNLENAINITKRNQKEPEKQTPVKSPEAKANFEKWKADRQEEKPKETAESLEQKLEKLNDELKELERSERNPITNEMSNKYYEKLKEAQSVSRQSEEAWKKESESKKNTPEYIKEQAEFAKQRELSQKQKESELKVTSGTHERWKKRIKKQIDNSFSNRKDSAQKVTTLQEQPKPKENVIQSGSRGATIAGQQYSKREVDILNSLDEIIGRAKSPVVQDLIKKRQAATIELPSKELGQPKLAAHESKFMELVKRNRSQADKQAGYPAERRKVEAETGVKIPREKAVEMTKHMKASFIWDIKKPSLIR